MSSEPVSGVKRPGSISAPFSAPLFSQRTIACNDQVYVRQFLNSFDSFKNSLARNQSTYHQHNRNIGRESRICCDFPDHVESSRINTLGIRTAFPAIFVPFEVFRFVQTRPSQWNQRYSQWSRYRPITVLRHIEMRRAIPAMTPLARKQLV